MYKLSLLLTITMGAAPLMAMEQHTQVIPATISTTPHVMASQNNCQETCAKTTCVLCTIAETAFTPLECLANAVCGCCCQQTDYYVGDHVVPQNSVKLQPCHPYCLTARAVQAVREMK